MGPLNTAKPEISDDNIIRMPLLDYTPDPGGMGKVFYTKMSSYGDSIAQVNGWTGEKDTYRSFLQRSIRTAITMRSKGIGLGDVITICSFNHLNSSVPFVASLFLGAKLANLDPTISLNDAISLLKQVRPKMIFVGPEAVTLIEQALRETELDTQMVVFGKSDHLEFSEFLKECEEEENFKPVEVKNDKETAIIFFSSGTTGFPKGICINHFSLLSQSFIFAERGFNTRVVGFASLYWISAALTVTICILRNECRIVCPRFDPDKIWNIVSDHKSTSMFLSPTELIMIYKRGPPKDLDVTQLRDLFVVGGPLSADQILKARKVVPHANLVFGYGQTEITGICTIFQPNVEEDMVLMKNKPGSAGRALSGFWYKIVDPDTEEILGANQRGEIRLKTDFQMNGYHNLDSSSAWDVDGWLKTGDMGYYDEDLCFFIVDRVKEMLKYRSWHVAPALLECILLTHPEIESAVVVGLPHPEDGDHPTAIVVLKNGTNRVSEEEIERYVAERVDERQKLRGGVKIVDSIPITPTGKIKRREVKSSILKGLR